MNRAARNQYARPSSCSPTATTTRAASTSPEAIKECQRAETIIYSISTNWTPSRGQGDKVMAQLAEDTGGRVFFPPSVEEVSTSFHDIEEELRSQYALTYTPADFKDNGAFRTIYLYCNDRRYQVRAKKGYFAPRN